MNLPPWLTKGGLHLRARALWAGVFALLALLWRFGVPAPPVRSAEGVAAMLGDAVGGEVRPDDFVWEERGGFLSDTFLGRRVLFLARRRGEEAGDLFRARVRLTRTGRPVSLLLIRNLSRSPRGDDRDLIARGHHAAYVTMGDGVVQGIALLDLDGEGAAREARTFRERVGASVESWLSSGNTQGVGRTEITFGSLGKSSAAPPAEARVELAGDLLVMALGKEALPAALDLRDGSLNTGPRNVFAAQAQRIPHLARPLGEVSVEVLRELVGPVPARALRVLVGSPQKSAPRGPLEVFPGRAPPLLMPPAEGGWPPPALSPRVQPSLPGEGIWAAPVTTGTGGSGKDAPPAFFETAIRPSPRRPEALVRLVALDLRQVDLRLEAGVEAPRAATGLRGLGRLPAEEPVVAAFTVGPAAPEGISDSVAAIAPGFVVDRRVLAPPLAGAATVAILGDGHLSFGAWTFGAALPADLASLAQTPDPLLGGDGRAPLSLQADVWAERSALCRLPSGQVIYAWGAEVSPATLAEALSMAGCAYAVPLSASPAPTGFAYFHGAAEATLLAPEMSLSTSMARLTGAPGSPNAFFYAVRHDARPSTPLPAGVEWAPDAGEQPAPAWIPSIYSAIVANLGAQIHLTSFAPGRVVFRLRAGGKEPMTKAASALPGALAEAEQARALAAIGIGAGRKRGARGLTIEGTAGYPFRGDTAGILAINKGKIEIAPAAGFTLPPGADATELPLIADDGKLRPEAREVSSMRPRAVACVLEDGTFVVGSTTFDSDEAGTAALLDLGCTRVVALDRGSHHSAFMHRAGTEAPPAARYEASAIYAVDAPLTGRARSFGGD